MIHYLLLKFKPGFFSDEVFSMAVEVFTGIGKALAGSKMSRSAGTAFPGIPTQTCWYV